MRKIVNTTVAWVLGVASALWVAMLFGFGSGALTDDPPAPEDNPYAGGQTTTVPNPSSTSGGDTTSADGGQFVVSALGFEHDGWVEIRNSGTSAGSLEGHWMCNRPSYFPLPDITLDPGEKLIVAAQSSGDGLEALGAARSSVTVVEANGSIGRIHNGGGEIGLYSSSAFGSADDIVSYVEWGSAGHGRSSVAVEAGVWEENAFVFSDDVLFMEATVEVPTGPEDWVAAMP